MSIVASGVYSFGRKDFSDGSKSEIMHKMRVIRITERVVKIIIFL